MALRRRKKPGTAQDLDALLLALTGSADAPQQAPTGKSKKRKKSKGSTALQAASPKVKALERSARKPATGGRATRTARRALQVSELTAQPASGKKERQKITPSKQKLKSSARRPAARDVMGEEEDDGNEGDDSGDDDDDCDQEDGAQAVAVARKGKSVTGAQKHVNGAPSPSSDDTGGEDFILVMKRMTLERKKQRERDARKIDAFFLARMKKSEQEAEQKILAIGAEASEATRLYRSKEITGIQKKKNAETKVIKDLTKRIPSLIDHTIAEVNKESLRFVSIRKDASTLAAAESKARQQRLRGNIAKAKATAQAVAKKRIAREKLLADALASMLKCTK